MSSIQLTRAERREMKRLGKLVDRATEADRLFFECRLDQQHRPRLASQAEINQHELIDGKPPAVPPGFQLFVAVRNVARGARMRLSLPAPEGSETDVCEATARAILEAPATAYTWEIEAAMRRGRDVFPLRHWPLRSRGGDEHEDKTAATLKATVRPGPGGRTQMQTPNESARLLRSSASLNARTSRRTTSRAAFVRPDKENCKCQRTKRKSIR